MEVKLHIVQFANQDINVNYPRSRMLPKSFGKLLKSEFIHTSLSRRYTLHHFNTSVENVCHDHSSCDDRGIELLHWCQT